MPMRILALLLLLLFALPAYAGRQDAELALTTAQSAVAAAERTGAAEFAPTDFARAQESLAQASGAYDERDWDDSVMDAEKSHLDARVAEARSRQVRAESTNREIEAALNALRVEIQRSGG